MEKSQIFFFYFWWAIKILFLDHVVFTDSFCGSVVIFSKKKQKIKKNHLKKLSISDKHIIFYWLHQHSLVTISMLESHIVWSQKFLLHIQWIWHRIVTMLYWKILCKSYVYKSLTSVRYAKGKNRVWSEGDVETWCRGMCMERTSGCGNRVKWL